MLSVRKTLFEEVFFWSPTDRTKFVMIRVAKFLKNYKFINAVTESEICGSQWDLHEPRLGDLNLSFDAVLKHCNDYRDGLNNNVPDFNGSVKMDCVSLVYAAYTHRNQISVADGLDLIIRVKFPRLFVILYRIIRSLDTKVG